MRALHDNNTVCPVRGGGGSYKIYYGTYHNILSSLGFAYIYIILCHRLSKNYVKKPLICCRSSRIYLVVRPQNVEKWFFERNYLENHYWYYSWYNDGSDMCTVPENLLKILRCYRSENSIPKFIGLSYIVRTWSEREEEPSPLVYVAISVETLKGNWCRSLRLCARSSDLKSAQLNSSKTASRAMLTPIVVFGNNIFLHPPQPRRSPGCKNWRMVKGA